MDEYNEEMRSRIESGEITDIHNLELQDTTRYYTASGRVVYGGGGIIPDEFISIDTSLLDEDYMNIRIQVPVFALKYYDKNKSGLKNFTLDSYVNNFVFLDATIEELVKYAESRDDNNSSFSLEEEQSKRISTLLKARLAKHLFGDIGFYKVWDIQDEEVQGALKTLHSPAKYTEKK